MNEEEKAKLAEARAAQDRALALLAETRSRTAQVEHMASWLRRARAENHFSQRIAAMLQNPGGDDQIWR